MTYSEYRHPYYCQLWYPANVAFEAATYSLRIKAPEVQNSESRGRNQVFARTKTGATVVADYGVKLNNTLKLQFNHVPDIERSSLVVFLDAIQYGKLKLAYQDYRGAVRTVRINTPNIEYKDTGLQNKADQTTILWDFALELLDITDNIFEQDGTLVPTALALHLSDYNDPHNPKVTVTVNAADGAKVVQPIDTLNYRAVTWIVSATKAAQSIYTLVSATHNRNGSTDATTIDVTQQQLADVGSSSANIIFGVTLTGVGSAQVMNLTADTTTDGWTVTCRRIKT